VPAVEPVTARPVISDGRAAEPRVLMVGAAGGALGPLTFVALVMAAGGLIAAVLGRETRGQKLL
jgi:hypothetical protein